MNKPALNVTHRPPDELLTEQEAAAYLGVSVSGLRKWRNNRRGPQYYRLGRLIRYTRFGLKAWLQTRVEADHSGTADASE